MLEKTILIVEDEKLIARDLQKTLQALGYRVPASYSSGDQLLPLIDREPPDLIILDIKLEGDLDGIEIAGKVREKADIPIVFLTAHPDDHYIERAKSVQPAGYLLKPFNERELEITITLALHKHAMLQQLKESEARYRQLFETIPIGLYHASSEGQLIEVNQALVQLLGYADKAECIQSLPVDRYTDADAHLFWLSEIFQQKTIQGRQIQWKRKNGQPVWVLESVNAIYDDHNEIQYFQGAVQDITAQKENEADLQVTKNALENYIYEMKEYARIASHDLQEPIRQVSGYTQLLAKRYSDKLDSEANEFIAFITEGSERMQSLITDFVDYTQVLTKTPDRQDLAVEAILASVESRFQPVLSAINGKITYDKMPVISADPAMIQLLFEHLIDNAIKYKNQTPPSISIAADVQSDKTKFTVRDNGIGIQQSYHNQIFQLFKRLHSKRNYPGTGLGLAICKQIVKKHGGEIWVDSNDEEGAAFSFTIAHEAHLIRER